MANFNLTIKSFKTKYNNGNGKAIGLQKRAPVLRYNHYGFIREMGGKTCFYSHINAVAITRLQ